MSEEPAGIIGGSGLYEMPELEVLESVEIPTPFGEASDEFTIGRINGRDVVFLPRHGRGHRLLPSELPFRANIWAMKKLGVQWILSVSAVGSMKPDLHPRDVVLPDQFIDRTRSRADTFFGNGVVAHISFSDPVCPNLHRVMAEAAETAGATVQRHGTYLCIEGPAFSTRAESRLYRSWDVDVIGMTNYQEARLAREAEICYASLACITDYDCWHEDEEAVTVEMLMDNLKHNAILAQKTVANSVEQLPIDRDCPCGSSLENALLTSPDQIPESTRRQLDIIIGKYLQ
ncbi:MAG: S-methyl-5'-thioadenosine phosphorylase [Planctomycetota bacterium]